MTIGSVSSSDPYQLQSLFQQSRQDLQALTSDITSGNLPAAKKDFSSFQQDVVNLFQSQPGPLPTPSPVPQGGVPTPSPVPQGRPSTASADLQALQSALNANDIASAQKDLSAFKTDIQSFGGAYKGHRGHHGHHRHSQENDIQSAQTSSTNASPASTTASFGTTSNQDNRIPDFMMASLVAAYNAFNNSATTGSALKTLA